MNDQFPGENQSTTGLFAVLLFVVGFLLGLMPQVLVIQLPGFLYEVLPNLSNSTLDWWFISVVTLVFEATFAAGAFAIARVFNQITFFQGFLVSVIVSFLLISGCWYAMESPNFLGF